VDLDIVAAYIIGVSVSIIIVVINYYSRLEKMQSDLVRG
jgi:hypothetical protein